MGTLIEDIQEVMEPWDLWAHQCHGASLHLVRSGVLGVPGEEARVVRGSCHGVGGQHSWCIVGDIVEPRMIVDSTYWSYMKSERLPPRPKARIIKGDSSDYEPKGAGSIFSYGRPPEPFGDIIDPPEGLSASAKAFLRLCGPLDQRGWHFLFHAPCQGWPSKEILTAWYESTSWARAMIPIDHVGNWTDLNPQELYW